MRITSVLWAALGLAVLASIIVTGFVVVEDDADAANAFVRVRPRDLRHVDQSGLDMTTPPDLTVPPDLTAPPDLSTGDAGPDGFAPWYRGVACAYQPIAPVAGSGATITPSTTYTLLLTTEPPQVLLSPVATATPSEAGLAPPMLVHTPNTQCPSLLGRVLPMTSFPRNSAVRQVEAYWNGTRLPLISVFGTPQAQLVNEGHSYGAQMTAYNTPLYDLTGIAAGNGTLEMRGYDATNHEIWKIPITGLHVSLPPTPVANATIQATSHPRFLLTPARLANAAAKVLANDTQAQAYVAARDFFLAEWNLPNHDVSGAAFNNAVYNPGAYAAVLALCYQLDKVGNPTRSGQCRDAGKAISAWRLSTSVPTEWQFDTCYNMRSKFQDQLLLYDWLYAEFTSGERAAIRANLIAWVNYYLDSSHGCYSISNPPNNYYPPLLWAMAGVGISMNGEDAAAAGFLTTLRTKLAQEQTLLNQRACGGVWLEGTNYDSDSMLSDLQVMASFQDFGEDWTEVFEAIIPRGIVYPYGVTRTGSIQLAWGGVSGNKPTNIDPSVLAALQSLTAFGSYVTQFYNTVEPLPNDWNTIRQPAWNDVVFGNLTQTGSTPSALSCVSSGAGRAYSVSTNTIAGASTGYTVAMESQHQGYDHYGYSNADVRFYKGGTRIIGASAYQQAPACNFDGEGSTGYFSTMEAEGQIQYEYNRNRNNRFLFAIEQPTYSAWGVDYTSSMQNTNSYDELYFTAPPPEYQIREVVHVRPDVLVVRNVTKRTSGASSLVSFYHMGPTTGGTNVGGGVYTIGSITIATTTSSAFSSVVFSDDFSAGCLVGRKMTITYPNTTAEIDDIEVFSDTGVTINSYSGGVLHLSNSKCVTFGGGTVSVAGC